MSKLTFRKKIYIFLLFFVLLIIFIGIKIVDAKEQTHFLFKNPEFIFSQNILKPKFFNNLTEIKNNEIKSIKFHFKDKRAFVFDKYFQINDSPLVGLGELFVIKCEQYNAPLDCISTVAIAKHETDLCKYPGSKEMYNCWGFGGGGEHRISFSSFYESIDRVTQVLAEQYGYRYMVNPVLMESVFCGTQEECNGWGERILNIMDEINRFSINLGIGDLYLLR